MAKKAKKWIAGATPGKTEGTFTSYCKRQGFKGVTQQCVQKGLASSNPTTRKRAQLAKTLRKIGKK